MAGASDKARFYLERSVPELQEYERKEIFTPEEIRAIAAKRSDFEHRINARGSKSGDYARYATYEMNLDSLRKKRSKRLGVKSTNYSGQRAVFFVLERATKKFPGDMALWMQYIEFCKKERANKKLVKIFTNVLRLKPREWGLWVLAAKYYAETVGDMSTARSYMQRGLRFCKDERKLWLEYMRLEMVFLAKLAARRKVLGLDEATNESVMKTDNADSIDSTGVTGDDMQPASPQQIDDVDDHTLKKLSAAPAFTGAIPMAIFDAAMKQFNDDTECAQDIFDLCAGFDSVSSAAKVLQHILDHLQSHSPNSTAAVICHSKMCLFGCASDSAEFPLHLGRALAIVKQNQPSLEPRQLPGLAEKVVLMLVPFLRNKAELDDDIVIVLEASVKRYLRTLANESSSMRRGDVRTVDGLTSKLRREAQDADADNIERYCTDQANR